MEVLITIAVVSVLSSLAYVTYSSLGESSREAKLESDVAVVNQASRLYVANGGTFIGNETVEEVINKLKSSATAASGNSLAGMTGSLIDRRIVPVLLDSEEIETSRLRASWDSAQQQFVVSRNGSGAVREFQLREDLALADYAPEERSSTLAYASQTAWVWDFEDHTPVAVEDDGVSPTVPASQQLAPPTFDPPGGSLPLSSFDPDITLVNPNPAGSSTIYYSTGGSQLAEYNGESIKVSPGGRIVALAVSLNPSQWTNSQVSSAQYNPIPLQLIAAIQDDPGSMTYAQAGGVMEDGSEQTPNTVKIVVTNLGEIPAAYRTSDGFEIYATTDGSDPLAADNPSAIKSVPFDQELGPLEIDIALPNWGGQSTFPIRAVVRAKDSALFIDSQEVATTIAAVPTLIPAPVIDPADSFMLPNWVEIVMPPGVYPVGLRIFYTMDGTPPLDESGAPHFGSLLYKEGFNPEMYEDFSISAQAAGPAGLEHWFSASAESIAYYLPTGAGADVVGAIVGSGNIDGAFFGSLIFANPSGQVNFNSQGRILGGNLYLPGLPSITVQPSPGLVVAQGQNFVEGPVIPRNVIAGKHYLSDGVLADPQTDLRQIVDLGGDITPSTYSFRFNANSYLEGKVYRRANPPEFPEVILPVGLPSMGNIDMKSDTPPTNLAPGRYSSVSMGSDSNILRLGVAGSEEPTVYQFDNANFNKGAIEMLGPVVLYFPNGFNLSQVVMGDVDQPQLLEIQVATGSVNVNSSGTLASRLIAPSSTVSLNGVFRGTLIAKELKVNGNGVAFTLPPIIEGT